VGLEQGPLSLVSTIEELLERKSSGSGLETENTAVGIRCSDHTTPQTKAMKFSLFLVFTVLKHKYNIPYYYYLPTRSKAHKHINIVFRIIN
jgi:hypothetical protein